MRYALLLFSVLGFQNVFAQTFNFNNESEGLTGNLIVSADSGLYSISYNGIVTDSAEDNSLLTFTVEYTDAATSELVIIPSTNIDNYNTTVSNIAGKSNINGNFIVYPQAGTAIRYNIQYASNPTSDMKYSMRISIEKL